MILQVAAAGALLALGAALIPPIASAKAVEGGCATASEGVHVSLDAEQRSNLALVLATGDKLQVGHEGKVIAVMTTLTESSLRNLSHGDKAGPDSRGLFQQRNGWGPLDVRMDPRGASGLFYAALLKVPAWMALEPWKAAQAVQRSAFSDGRNYKSNYEHAAELAGAVGPATCGSPSNAGDVSELPGAQAAVARAMSMVGQHGYYQLCARLAATIWGHPRAGYLSAAEQWSHMVATSNAHLDRQPPLGALVFWDTGGPYGHVAVYVGGDRIVSNDIHDQYPGDGGVYIVDFSAIEAEWNATYLGWAPPIYAAPPA